MAAVEEFDILSIKKLEELKNDIVKIIKQKKALEKKEKAECELKCYTDIRDTLKPGDKIVFRYKDGTSVGVVQKINAKTFTVAFSVDGEDKVLVRAYHLFIRIAGEEDKIA